MSFGINSGLSGLRVNAEKMRVVANNLVNINTPAYKAGVRRSSNVDIPTEIVSMLEAKQGFKANAKVIKSADELLKSTLDILA